MNPVEELLRGHIRDCREKIAAAVASVDALESLMKRLDAPPPQPLPQVHKLNGWSAEEDTLLREHYAILGPAACQKLLPHRSAMAIRTHASRVLNIARLPAAQRLWCSQCETKVTQGQVASCPSSFCAGKQAVIEGATHDRP